MFVSVGCLLVAEMRPALTSVAASGDGLVTWVNPLDGADAVGIRAEQVGVAREHSQQLALPCQGLAL